MQRYIHYFLCCFIFMSSCSPPITPLKHNAFNNLTTRANYKDPLGRTPEQLEQIMARIRNKPTYTKPLALSVDSQLMNTSAKAFRISSVFTPTDFNLKQLPNEAWFVKTYQSSDVAVNDIETLSPPDSNPRHRVQLMGNYSGKITIKLNDKHLFDGHLAGDGWLSPAVLINENDRLTIMLSSTENNDQQLHINILKDGETGHVFRALERSIKTVSPGDQLWDPSDPNSLKNLKAHEGEMTSLLKKQVTAILVNETDRLDFQSSHLILEVGTSNTLPRFQALYGGSVVDQFDDRYLIKLDLDKSPVSQLPTLIRRYNQAIDGEIQSAAFASVAGMQTYAILLDALVNHPELELASIEMNVYPELHQTPTPSATPIPSPTPHTVCPDHPPKSGKDWLYNDMNIGYSWWLTDTRVVPYEGSTPPKDAAWNYSLGSNIKVAHLDQGFNQNHSEIKRRTIVGQGYNNTDRLGQPGGSVADHGHKSLMTLGAEKSNNIGSAGVAPNVQMIPYHAEGYWEMEAAVKHAKAKGVHIIASSSAGPVYTWTTVFMWLIIPIGFFTPVIDTAWHGYARAIDSAVDSGIVFITSAGNDRKSYNEYIPAALPSVITVGYVAPIYQERCRNRLSYSYPPPSWTPSGSEALSIGNLSNFGDNLIWAPGDYILVSDRLHESEFKNYSGTSAASPFVAGVVALMKSRNPDLTPSCIKQILRDSQNQGVPVKIDKGTHPNFPSHINLKMVNALEAVKMAVQRNSSCQTISETPKAAEAFGGIVTESGGQKKLLTWQSFVPSANAADKEKMLVQSVSNEVWAQLKKDEVVMTTGWTNIKAGETPISAQQLELSEVTSFCSASQCLSKSPAKPEIIAVSASTNASAASEFTLTLKGKQLFPDIRPSMGRKFRVEFHPVGGGSPIVLSYNLEADKPAQNIWNVDKVTKIDHAASEVSFKIPVGSVPTGNYNLVFDSPLIGKSAMFTGISGGFQIAATGGSGAIFIEATPPDSSQLPQNNVVYNWATGKWIQPGAQVQVDANEFAGIHFSQPIRNLEVKIGPVQVPIVSVLQDLAVIGIPETLPAGVHDVIVKASGQTLTLEQAVNKVSQAVQPTPEPSPPPSAAPRQHRWVHIDNLEGNDEGRVYLNDRLILTGHAGNTVYYEFSESDWDRQKPNEIRFELTNQGGGYSYRFSLTDDNGRIVYLDDRGQAGVKNIQRNGQEDTTQGLVYQERIHVHEHHTPVGSGPYWIKLFNLRQDAELEVHASHNDLHDIQWETGSFKMRGHYDEVAKQLPFHTLESDPRSSGSWMRHDVYFSSFGPEASQPIGIEVYKGINLIYRQIKGQAYEPSSPEPLEPPLLEYAIELLLYPHNQ